MSAENIKPEATDGIYFAVPRRILENELEWKLSHQKFTEIPLPEQTEPERTEAEQHVPLLRTDHPRLIDHFSQDVDEYLLRCSLDKFENDTVASFRKDVITQLSVVLQTNPENISKKSLDSGSSDEGTHFDLFPETEEELSVAKENTFSSVYKNFNYSKQSRLLQNGVDNYGAKSQGLNDFRQYHTTHEGSSYSNSNEYSIESMFSTNSSKTKVKNDLIVKDEDNFIWKIGRQKNDPNWTCLQESLRSNSSGEESMKNFCRQDDSSLIDSPKDLMIQNENDSKCLQEPLEADQCENGKMVCSQLHENARVKNNDNQTIQSECKKNPSTLIYSREDPEIKKENAVSTCLQENLEADGQKYNFNSTSLQNFTGVCSSYSDAAHAQFQINNVDLTDLPEDMKVESKEHVLSLNFSDENDLDLTGKNKRIRDSSLLSKELERKNKDLNPSSKLPREDQIEDSCVDETEDKHEGNEVTLSSVLGLEPNDWDVISRRKRAQRSNFDKSVSKENIQIKSSDILSRQSLFLHSMINELSNSVTMSNDMVSKSYEEKKMDRELSRKKLYKKSGSEDESKEKEGNKFGQIENYKNKRRMTNEDNIKTDVSMDEQQVTGCQTQTSDFDSANDQTSKDIMDDESVCKPGKRGKAMNSHAWKLSERDLSAVTLKEDRTEVYFHEKDIETSCDSRPKCLPRTAISLPTLNSSESSTKTYPGEPRRQIHENYKFFREKSSTFSISDVIPEYIEEEVSSVPKSCELSQKSDDSCSVKLIKTPTPSPRNIKHTEDARSNVLIISVSDEGSNETVKSVINIKHQKEAIRTVGNIKQPNSMQSSPEVVSEITEMSPFSRLASRLSPITSSPDPLDWAQYLSRDFPPDTNQQDVRRSPGWDASPSPELSSSLWLSCSEDDRQANLLNYEFFRTDFSDADPDLNSHWPFTNTQPKSCLSVFHSECYALHL